MATEHEGDEPVASGAAASDPAGDVDAEDVIYAEVNGEPVTGYLARPAGGGEGLPGSDPRALRGRGGEHQAEGAPLGSCEGSPLREHG